MRVRRIPRRFLAAATLVLLAAVLTGCDDPPRTINSSVNYDCQINPNHILLSTFTDNLSYDYATTAPQAVKPAGEFLVTVAPPPFTVNGTTSGGTVSQLTNMVYRVNIPANATLVSHAISGWANVGAATPTSTVSGGAVVITIPGPMLSNVPITVPALTMNLKATGALGSRIEPKIGGTSYAAPGLTFTSQVTGTILGTLNPTFKCFPSPSPALNSTLISNDVNAPKITVTSPTANQTVVQGSSLVADFSCDDGTGVGVASCVGTVADGASINTSTLGAKTFTVTATDNEGKVATTTVNYTVVAP
jgi:dehydratase